jgi:1-acyl-sn-glycerol-3-phosphate acyltransferase
VGEDNLKIAGKRFILCSNHISNIDAIFLAVICKEKIHFLAKKELFKNKFFEFFLAKFGAIKVLRGGAGIAAIYESKKVLNSGKSLGVFIEGHRSKTGKFLKPRSGAVVIALSTGASIVPVCIVPQKSKRIKIFKKTKITFGVPFELKEKTNEREKIYKITENLMETIKSLK